MRGLQPEKHRLLICSYPSMKTPDHPSVRPMHSGVFCFPAAFRQIPPTTGLRGCLGRNFLRWVETVEYHAPIGSCCDRLIQRQQGLILRCVGRRPLPHKMLENDTHPVFLCPMLVIMSVRCFWSGPMCLLIRLTDGLYVVRSPAGHQCYTLQHAAVHLGIWS